MASGQRASKVYHFSTGAMIVEPNGDYQWIPRPDTKGWNWEPHQMPEDEMTSKKRREDWNKEFRGREGSPMWFVYDEMEKFIDQMANIPWMPRSGGLTIDIIAEVVEDERKTAQEAPLLIEGPSEKKGRKRSRRNKSDGV